MFAYIGLISQLSVFHGPILVGSLIEVFKLFKPFHTEYIGFNGFITFSLEPPYTYRSLCPFPPGGVSLLSTPLLLPLKKYKIFKHVISFSIYYPKHIQQKTYRVYISFSSPLFVFGPRKEKITVIQIF